MIEKCIEKGVRIAPRLTEKEILEICLLCEYEDDEKCGIFVGEPAFRVCMLRTLYAE